MALEQHHKLFLQAFLAQGIMSAKRVREVHKTVLQKIGIDEGDDASLSQIVHKINDALVGLEMLIKKVISENDGTHYYGLLCTAEPPSNMKTCSLSKAELDYLKELIRQMVNSDSGKMSSIDALNLTRRGSEVKGVTLARELMQPAINRMIEAKWLYQDSHGQLSLGVRSQLELETFIKRNFDDVLRTCYACQANAIVVSRCERCDTTMHEHCAARLRKNQPALRCPACKAPWPESDELETTQSKS